MCLSRPPSLAQNLRPVLALSRRSLAPATWLALRTLRVSAMAAKTTYEIAVKGDPAQNILGDCESLPACVPACARHTHAFRCVRRHPRTPHRG